MSKLMQKILTIILISALSLCFCIVVSQAVTVNDNINLSPMTDGVTYSLQGAPSTANALVNKSFNLNLNAVKVLGSDTNDYTVTAISLTDGSLLPDGLSLSGKDISGAPTAAGKVSISIDYEFSNADGLPQIISSNLEINVLQTLTYSLKNLPTEISCIVGNDLEYDFSSVKIVDDLGVEYSVNNVEFLNAAGDTIVISVNGAQISAKTLGLINKIYEIKFAYTNSDAEESNIIGEVLFNIHSAYTYSLINVQSSISGRANSEFKFDFSAVKAVDNTGVEYSISIAETKSTLPNWLSLAQNTLQGSPTEQEQFNAKVCFEFQCAEGYQMFITEDILFDIKQQLTYTLVNVPTIINGEVGSSLNVDLSAAKVLDSDGAEYAVESISETVVGSMADNGYTFENNTIGGFQTKAKTNTLSFNFIFTDGENVSQTVSQQITIVITDNMQYSLDNAPDSLRGRVGTVFSKNLNDVKISDGRNNFYAIDTITLANGSTLPDGLTLIGKDISGTPLSSQIVVTSLVYTFKDINADTRYISQNVTFTISDALTYALQGLPVLVNGTVGTALSQDLSQVTIKDNLGASYQVDSISLAALSSLPSGLNLNGKLIEGNPEVIQNNTATKFNFSFINADGIQQTITSEIKFKIIKIAENIIFSNIPTAAFVYNISNPVYLGNIRATKDNKVLDIENISCMGALPQGLTFANNTLDGKAQELRDLGAVQFKAIFKSGEFAYFDVNIQVSRQPLGNMIIDSQSFQYNGQSQYPDIKVYDKAGVLLSNSCYELKFYRKQVETTDLTSCGKLDIQAVGIGNYTGLAVQAYMINQVLADESLIINFDNVVYNGNSHQLPPIFNNYSEKDYSVEYFRGDSKCTDFINVGEITVKVTFSGNYTGQIIKKYKILSVEASISDVVFAADEVYNGKGHMPVPKVDEKWKIDKDYVITINGAAPSYCYNVGEYLVEVKFKNNVSGEFKQVFVISPKPVEINSEGTVDYIYDGHEKLPTTYILGDYKKGEDYDIKYYRADIETTDFVSIGEIKVVIQMKKNYSGYKEEKYRIYPRSLSIANTENYDITIASNQGFLLNHQFGMEKLDNVSFKIRYGAEEKLEYAIKVNMFKDGESVDLSSLATVKLKTDISAKDIKNIRIEYFERGVQQSKSAAIDSNGYIVFDIYSVGEIAIIVEYPAQDVIPTYVYWAIGGGVLALIFVIVIVIYVISKNTGVRTILPNRRK